MGADGTRYAPVPRLAPPRAHIAGTEDVPPDGLRVNYRIVIEIEGGQRLARVADVIVLHYR